MPLPARLQPAHVLRHWRAAGGGLLLLAGLALSLGTACAGWRQVFAENGRVFFVDADCYSRMTRVRAVCEHPGHVVGAHDFENYPLGTRPHTTALLDYAVWALRGILKFVRGGETRDLAGAWISPMFGLVAVAGVGRWAGRERLPGRWLLMGIVAASPILAHGFALGRPDHQSLVLACMAWALAAEWAQWRAPSRSWGIIGGIAWALGLWTSLYEPLILLVLVVAAGGLFNRAALRRRERLPGLAAGGAILLLALAVDGWRVDGLPGFGGGGGAPYFEAWTRQIGELASVPPWAGVLFHWTGCGLLLAPVLLLLPRRSEDEEHAARERPAARAHLLLLVAVWALTCWQVRWGYFLPLIYAMSLPSQLGAFPARWRLVALAVLVAGLWPMAGEWWTRAHPDTATAEALAEQRDDTNLLRETADFIGRSSADSPSDSHGILAPWWQCPPLVYWSGQPAVAGSSHESLPGTVDTARFYLETDARAAADILRDRRVRWVVAYEPQRVLNATAAPLLGRPVFARCFGEILYLRPELAPRYLRLALVNPYFKVYEVRPAALP